MFTQAQLNQLDERKIKASQVIDQIETFKKGILPVKLAKPALQGDGVEVFEENEIENYVCSFQSEKKHFSLLKFVPASGAASRMFKLLFDAINEFNSNPDNSDKVLRKMPEIASFFAMLSEYPFYYDLIDSCKKSNQSLDSLIKERNFVEILKLLLFSEGLAYGQLPKGLLKFHRYNNETCTAFEEHFREASMYLGDSEDRINLHFTVSPEHLSLFEELSNVLINKYLKKSNTKFKVTFSIQKPSTDTLAVDLSNNPFLDNSGRFLFRPGGHGALLDNMQDLDEQIIFVGNIDNVAPIRTQPLRIRYKKLLAGVLIERVKIIHSLLNRLEKSYTDELKIDIIEFINKYVSITSAQNLTEQSDEEFNSIAEAILNRPIRICGMVKNVGEPGGGPFWVAAKNNNISKQIVESSQVDILDLNQTEIFKKASHFNPVDLVCFTRNYRGQKFNLKDFRDPDMAFIAEKSQGSSTLKALELPGLWNGSMAGWMTFFVDVPIATFSPVKTIFDLVREEHLS